MPTPTTVLGAVVAIFDASAAAALLTNKGGLWVGGVPEDKFGDLPQVVLLHYDETPAWNFEEKVVEEEGRFDLVVYAVGLANAEALAAQIRAAFDPSSQLRGNIQPGDWVPLGIANTTAGWVERQGYQVKLVEYRAADSSWVYEITLPYKSYVARKI